MPLRPVKPILAAAESGGLSRNFNHLCIKCVEITAKDSFDWAGIAQGPEMREGLARMLVRLDPRLALAAI